MHCSGELQRRVMLTCAVAFLLAAHEGRTARADLTTALVPMYVYPSGAGLSYWNQLDASANQINIDAIVNPNSGPGDTFNSDYAAAIKGLDATKYGKAFGYISTFNPSGMIRSLSDMEADVQGYINLYGGKNFAGFFVDQMSITPDTLSTYQQLYAYIKTIKGSSYSVIGNPGSPYIYSSPTESLTAAQVLSTADQLVIFEGPNKAPNPTAAGFDRYPYGLDWFQNPAYSSSRFANIIYDAPADAGNPSQSAAMLSDLYKANRLNAGSIFITDGTGGNPYDHLPSYWNQEVAALAAIPEPSSLLVATACGLVGCAVSALRSRSRTQRSGG